jgi:hypothetical protein
VSYGKVKGDEMRGVAGLSPVRLGLLAALGVVLCVAVVASIAIWSGGEDVEAAPIAASSGGKNVRVDIAGTNDALESVTDGGIVGEGTFRATGAIRDRGTARAYRWLEGDEATGYLISFRYVTKGKKGAITYVVRIDTTQGMPPNTRWTIESGTEAYKGLQGEGTETENARYTVTYLRGKVWR